MTAQTSGKRSVLSGLRGMLGAAVIALGLAGCAPALKDVKPALTVSDSGTIWFATAGTLTRSADGRYAPAGPVVLSGRLQFPAGLAPFPTVILMHGCGGVGNAEQGWEPVLRKAGYATFVVDSFTGRGLREVCTDALALTGTQRVPDAYGALRILATHPKVDAGRVALMGFSHGGIVTVTAATAWAKETYAPAGQPAFRAFTAFYPYCNTRYPERAQISAPLRIHIGELDDWTPAATCRELVEELRAGHQDADIIVYPGAHHSFDNIGRQVMFLSNVQSAADCQPRAASVLGPLLNPEELGRCLRRGATIGWSPQATEQARRNVLEQLGVLLK